jgi:hypothetical protein
MATVISDEIYERITGYLDADFISDEQRELFTEDGIKFIFEALDAYKRKQDGEEGVIASEAPVLIGHLNRVYGYHGFEEAKIGTEVFRYENLLQFTVNPINSDHKPRIVKFHQNNLLKHVNTL